MPFFDPDSETLDRDALAALQRRKLSAMLAEVSAHSPFYREHLRRAGCERFDALTDPLENLPFTTREQIEQDQLDNPPYGTNLTYPLERYVRYHQTSGSKGAPLRWLDTPESWEWWKRCWATVFRAAGVEPADRIVFPFSFGPFIGFWSSFAAAESLGNLVLAAGGMTTAARLRYLLDNQATVLCCTPTYALHMAEVAQAEGVDIAASPVRLIIVAGEPGGGVPAVRQRIEAAWNARLIDHAGMTEVGAWGFEPVETPGVMLVNEVEFIAEVIDPAGRPVPDGQAGELVLTNLGRWGSPLIRYRTGDQVRLSRAGRTAGRAFARLDGGVLGRLDDAIIIRGNNVFPASIEGILREFAEVAEFRLVVRSTASLADLRLEIEPLPAADQATLAARIERAVRDRLHFKPHVQLVAPGSLPRFELKARRVVRE